jgi:hypothetical protein
VLKAVALTHSTYLPSAKAYLPRTTSATITTSALMMTSVLRFLTVRVFLASRVVERLLMARPAMTTSTAPSTILAKRWKAMKNHSVLANYLRVARAMTMTSAPTTTRVSCQPTAVHYAWEQRTLHAVSKMIALRTTFEEPIFAVMEHLLGSPVRAHRPLGTHAMITMLAPRVTSVSCHTVKTFSFCRGSSASGASCNHINVCLEDDSYVLGQTGDYAICQSSTPTPNEPCDDHNENTTNYTCVPNDFGESCIWVFVHGLPIPDRTFKTRCL